MAIAYVTSDPSYDCDMQEWKEEFLPQKWTIVFSPGLCTNKDMYNPQPILVNSCLELLSRSEVLVLNGDWEECELCRVENQFAEENNLIVKEGIESLDMSGDTFHEKFLEVEVDHDYRHAHECSIENWDDLDEEDLEDKEIII